MSACEVMDEQIKTQGRVSLVRVSACQVMLPFPHVLTTAKAKNTYTHTDSTQCDGKAADTTTDDYLRTDGHTVNDV